MFNTSKKHKFINDTDLLLLAEKVVARYVFAGTIPEKDKDDVKMTMVEKFLNKQDTIQQAFSGKSKVSTYCIAVLNRMCCEVIRKELKHWKNSNNEIPETIANGSITDSIAINDEAKYLHKVLLIFNDEYLKLKLFLAFFYQLVLKQDDIKAYSSSKQVLELFGTEGIKNKGDIFDVLAKVVNIAEQKQLKPDAVRMWLNKCIDTIIVRLNGPFNRANYNKETLEILFEYYYLKELSQVSKIKKGA